VSRNKKGYIGYQAIDIKSLELPEHVFNSIKRHCQVLIPQKASFGSFSFDRNSANDE
jgi:hypothetical protein